MSTVAIGVTITDTVGTGTVELAANEVKHLTSAPYQPTSNFETRSRDWRCSYLFGKSSSRSKWSMCEMVFFFFTVILDEG